MYSATKLFSNASDAKAWEMVMRKNTNSDCSYNERVKCYTKVANRFKDDIKFQRQFSGQSDFLISANQMFNATMASYAHSFAGQLAIERSMDHAHCTLYYNDLVGVTNNRKVLPNIGKENLSNINAKWNTKANFVSGQYSYDITSGKKIIPGSVTITIYPGGDASKAIVVRDDKKANLIGQAGLLETGTVDYKTAGRISFKIASTSGIDLTKSSYSISLFEDVAGTPDWNGTAHGNNRFKINYNEITVDASPDILIGESDIMSTQQYMKSLGGNPQEILGAKLTELYTKLLNEKLISTIQDNYVDPTDVVVIDPERSQFTDFKSRLHAFSAMLTKVDDALALKSIKGTKATAYFVGMGLANFFTQCRTTGDFVPNTDSTYINDLVGHFCGIPVYRHTLIGNMDGYAVHKTADGQLAPIMRGIFLPLTNTPVAGSYQNPGQLAQGVYYQEANEQIVPEFVQKFSLVA